MPLVSVIIPVYNTEIYLMKCINSIINQTLKDIEIIIVNDGSTDNSLAIIHSFFLMIELLLLIRLMVACHLHGIWVLHKQKGSIFYMLIVMTG
nr:Hyaluronan synthase [Providencia rettgeri]